MRGDSVRFGFATILCVALQTSCVEPGCDICPLPPGNLSGTVTMNGVPIAGVQMLMSGSATDAAETDANGLYALDAPHYGAYQVTPQLAGYAFRPTSRVVTVTGAASIDLNFTAVAGTVHAISGTVTGGEFVKIAISGDNTGEVIVGAGGAFTIPNLRLGWYVVTPTASGRTFTPAADTVVGVIDFEHNQTGNGVLGSVSLTSATWGMQDALTFFEMLPLNPPDAVGRVRPRRVEEISAGARTAFNAMWSATPSVTFAYYTDMGPQSYQLQLGANRTFVASSTEGFILTEVMLGATGLSFTATP